LDLPKQKRKSALDSQQDLELGEREGKRRENPQSKTHVEKTKMHLCIGPLKSNKQISTS
jgi:hypothetical protein